jgi:hypothetical protein
MQKRSRIIEQPEVTDLPSDQADDQLSGKNPAAVALGRLGGKKGGKVRAARMSAQERSDAARRAATARWSTRREEK